MQTQQTVNEGLKRAYTITITADELSAKIDAEIKKIDDALEAKQEEIMQV